MTMNRRGFIKVMAAGGGSLLIPSIFAGCDKTQRSMTGLAALDCWRGPDPAERDIRIILLSYALLAPNPHNKQPWLIEFKGPDRFDLYVDPSRLLPDTDPPYRQIHIAQGTFLENLSVAASHYGYRAAIEYFPQGLYGNAALENKPVASIQLIKFVQVNEDPLFSSILKRQSNKRVYAKAALSNQQIGALRQVFTVRSDCSLTITSDAGQCKKLAEFATQAMAVEVADKKRNEESIAMFRFNDDELNQHRDGFGVPQTGAEGIKKSLIEHFFISRKSFLEGSSFAEQSVKGTRAQAESAAAYGWLVTTNNNRYDQIMVGRLYNRINLTATALGVAMHPMSQVLQEYADMAALQGEFKRYLQVADQYTVQMFFRLGVAEPIRHSARRKLEDLMLSRQSATAKKQL